MDHSIRGYLSRRTDAELQVILGSCIWQEPTELDQEIARIVLDIFRTRSIAPSVDLPPDLMEYWRNCSGCL